jgi:hypothetical protein
VRLIIKVHKRLEKEVTNRGGPDMKWKQRELCLYPGALNGKVHDHQ